MARTTATNYRCVVTGGCGQVTSNQASLTLKAQTHVTQHPVSQTVPTGGSTQFSVIATGQGTIGYQWQKNGLSIVNGGHYAGATTTTLSISNADAADGASYRCAVSAECGSVLSNSATLTVEPPGVPGDLDDDGDVDLDDFGEFQLCLAGAGIPVAGTPCSEADLDNDNDVDGEDVSSFQNCLSGADIPGNPNCMGG